MQGLRTWLASGLLLSLAGCGGGDEGTETDGGAVLDGARDGGGTDASLRDDAGSSDDAGESDASQLDADTVELDAGAGELDSGTSGSSDAGASDATVADSGVRDSGVVTADSGIRDSGVVAVDAGPRDSGVAAADSGVRDSGVVTLDAGPRDSGVMAVDAGPRDSGVVTVDAGPRDSGVMAVDAGPRDSGVVTVDAGPRDAGIPIDADDSPNGRLATLRATPPGVIAPPQFIDTVQVTYVLPAVGDEPAGIFVQNELTGPAVFVAVNPATLSSSPIVRGVYASFSATETAVVNGQHRVTSVLPGSFLAGTTPVGGLVEEPQDITTLSFPSSLAALESEIIDVRFTVAGDFDACGLDHWCARITTSGTPVATASYRFRTSQALIESLGLDRGCYQDIQRTPLWRTNGEAQVIALRREDFVNVACPLTRIVGSVARSATRVDVVFDAPIAASSVVAADFALNGGATVSAATVSGRTVTLTTSALTAGSTYNVTLMGGITDVLGIDGVMGDTIGFRVPTSGMRPNSASQVSISELMTDPDGAAGVTWVELHNAGTTPLSLTGCVLTTAGGAHTLGTLSIGASSYVVLASGNDPGFTENYTNAAVSLTATTGTVTLSCDSIEIARVAYDGTFQAREGSSLSADPDLDSAFSSEHSSSFCVANATYGAAGQRGTPGSANAQCR